MPEIEAMRAELARSRTRILALERRVRELENQVAASEAPVILPRPDFNREVARMLAFDERYGGTSSVLYLDIENLAAMTTHHGEAFAVDLMRQAGDLLFRNVRKSDIIGRLAPDEFGVLLVRCGNAEAWTKAQALSDKLAAALAALSGDGGIAPQILYGAYTFREKEDVAAGIQGAEQGAKARRDYRQLKR